VLLMSAGRLYLMQAMRLIESIANIVRSHKRGARTFSAASMPRTYMICRRTYARSYTRPYTSSASLLSRFFTCIGG
jgi:hypothetical protein